MKKESMNSPCDFVWKARDNQPKPLTREQFLSFLDGMDVKKMVDLMVYLLAWQLSQDLVG